MRDLDEIETKARDHMRSTVMAAISSETWERPERGLIPATNAGHLFGVADVIVKMVLINTSKGGDPDYVAHLVANFIQKEIALQTSEGGLQ